MDMWSANRCRCSRGLKGSACVSRVGFGVAPKQAFLKTKFPTLRGAQGKFAMARHHRQTRETRALPTCARLRKSLRAFFEGGGPTFEMGENFAREV